MEEEKVLSVKESLKQGWTLIKYKTADGYEKFTVGTTNPDLVNMQLYSKRIKELAFSILEKDTVELREELSEIKEKIQPRDSSKRRKGDNIAYFDLFANGFRSFLPENLL